MCILGIKAVEDEARVPSHKQGEQHVVIVLVPALCWLSVGTQHQFLWRQQQQQPCHSHQGSRLKLNAET